jgi:hypothetical protein
MTPSLLSGEFIGAAAPELTRGRGKTPKLDRVRP